MNRMRSATLLALALFTFSVASAAAATPAVKVFNGSRSSGMVALTFDDCYRTANIKRIVAILREKNAAATFFCTGKAVQQAPAVFADLSRDFVLANHTWSHPNLNKKTRAQIISQMDRTKAIMEQVTGKPSPKIMRPPGGSANLATRTVLGELGYTYAIMWDIDTRDWTGISAADVRAAALKARSGSIVLMHDPAATVTALPKIINGLRNKGLRLVSLNQLLGLSSK
jgi:peptidoglycan-N-acetylglucosamine deacetylase